MNMNLNSIWQAGGERPILSFRYPVGYGGVETGFAIEQKSQRWANAGGGMVTFPNVGRPMNFGNLHNWQKWLSPRRTAPNSPIWP